MHKALFFITFFMRLNVKFKYCGKYTFIESLRSLYKTIKLFIYFLNRCDVSGIPNTPSSGSYVCKCLVFLFSVSWVSFNRRVACQDCLTAKPHSVADWLFMREEANGWLVHFLSAMMVNSMENTGL